MSVSRLCSRAACSHPATATLTYVYSDSTVVLGPLATYAEPHAYDLCAPHADRLTAPRGWDLVRLGGEHPAPSSYDDLVALAEVVRRSGRRGAADRPTPGADATGRPAPLGLARPGSGSPAQESASGVRETSRRGHLRVLRDEG